MMYTQPGNVTRPFYTLLFILYSITQLFIMGPSPMIVSPFVLEWRKHMKNSLPYRGSIHGLSSPCRPSYRLDQITYHQKVRPNCSIIYSNTPPIIVRAGLLNIHRT